MLFGAPPDWTLPRFLTSIDRLRLDRLRSSGYGPTLLNTQDRVRGHQPLLELLDRYRRGLLARADPRARARLPPVLIDAQRRFARVAPLLVGAEVSEVQRQAILAVLWNVIVLSVTALATGAEFPPLAWACWQSVAARHPVTGLDPVEAGDEEPAAMLRRGLRVDVGLIDPRGVAELVGAHVETSRIEPAVDGVQLRLVTARRGTWTIGPHGHGLAPVLWDRGLATPVSTRGARNLGPLGRIVSSWAPMTPGYDEVRFRFGDRRVLSVRRQIWAAPRITRVRFVPPPARGQQVRPRSGVLRDGVRLIGDPGRLYRRAS
jgi:hypothetical protein